MTEPLSMLYETYGFDQNLIKDIICGSKYFALMLTNGNIGVCSTLNKPYKLNNDVIKQPDLKITEHRILLNAYYNAQLNYLNSYKKDNDIFAEIKFRKYSNIVMTGYFGPLIKKFRKKNIQLHIFDKQIEHSSIVSMEQQMEYLSKADVLILSATTIFNNTFCEQIKNTSKNCDIFLLGPSAIMCRELLGYRNINTIFGTIFEKNDSRVLKQIKLGGGTKTFSPFARKVYFGH